jgi:hypothetical protein
MRPSAFLCNPSVHVFMLVAAQHAASGDAAPHESVRSGEQLCSSRRSAMRLLTGSSRKIHIPCLCQLPTFRLAIPTPACGLTRGHSSRQLLCCGRDAAASTDGVDGDWDGLCTGDACADQAGRRSSHCNSNACGADMPAARYVT